MNDLEEVMWEAWGKVGPMLRSNPDELRARLARRRSRMFGRPLRAFCLAVRASDARINPAKAILTPEDALDVTSEWHPGRAGDFGFSICDFGLVPLRSEDCGLRTWGIGGVVELGGEGA